MSHDLGRREESQLIVHDVGAAELTDLHRFPDPAEAAATLLVRDGHPGAIDHYLDRGLRLVASRAH